MFFSQNNKVSIIAISLDEHYMSLSYDTSLNIKTLFLMNIVK